ncbi:Hypothetical protein NG00_01887 [Corynebacterium camporealensis]|uniref:Uncharacterized protein n=1 Tax=Corynebacterium camporealensis TaxID=161896 RepID=A0A0F6TBJ7_9CORY|nr:DUF1707 domain-containing protein [Corynebacterium camporealensis]AKE40041.1 protein of unknown function (DUF1707) [Corynebacterium camporealensis]AVH89125.1 Hypothetical protein NG00_01887 [Corynebacterium camporealensis]
MSNYGSSQPIRLSDAERNDAINDLARAVGEGRLSMDEFEERSDDIMRAQTKADLVPVFRDIPTQQTNEVKLYSQGDIERARQAGRKPRLTTALVGTLGLGFGGTAVLATATGVGMVLGGLALFTLIPILWIMLYVAKVGPDSWHTPSVRQIERAQQREIRALTAAQRAEQKAIEQQMWAERRQQAGEITGQALDMAKKKFDKWNQK